jgi:2-polyprenyl-3-methyl-5-hydroxy-6-metoxy-1,4-benzoquinol methylase
VPEGARLEEVRCYFCSGRGEPATTLFEDPPFRVQRCPACGLVYVTPRIEVERLAEVYGEAYWNSPAAKDHGYTDYRKDAAHWRRTYRRRWSAVAPALPAGRTRVLDVGCAAGFFLDVVRERGHEGYGVELSPAIGRDARERLGADRVHVGTLAASPFPRASFHLVTLWDVVEHLPDPAAVLRLAREHLRPDGHLLLETQNVESRFARLLGRKWQHFKHAEHLYHFAPETIRRLLAESGFSTVSLTARRGGKYVGLDFIAERAGKVHPILSKALAPVSRAHGLALYVNLFDEMIVVARPA